MACLPGFEIVKNPGNFKAGALMGSLSVRCGNAKQEFKKVINVGVYTVVYCLYSNRRLSIRLLFCKFQETYSMLKLTIT